MCPSNPRTQWVVVVVNVDGLHWELGGVSSGEGIRVVFPIASWHENCQKIIDFLGQNKQRGIWKFPEHEGEQYYILSLFFLLTFVHDFFFFSRYESCTAGGKQWSI